MAVRPLARNPDGTLAAYHDERQHATSIPASLITFGTHPDGTPDPNYLVLPCQEPGCDSVSLHPVGGGCDPSRVQLLFAVCYKASTHLPTITTFAEAVAEVTQRALEMDGEARPALPWPLDDPAPAILANSLPVEG